MENQIKKLPKRIREKWDEFARIIFEAVYTTTTVYDVLIVSFSGGPDSTALLYACAYLRDNFQRLSKRYGNSVVFPDDFTLKVVAAHLDHSIRMKSANDAKWCSKLAQTLNIEFALKRLEENEIDNRRFQTSAGIETTARELRREFQIKLAQSIYGNGLALTDDSIVRGLPILLNGHTANDQAETVLMNLARGSGLRGACGIAQRSVVAQLNTDETISLEIVRPFLYAPKSDLLSLLDESKFEYLTDETNFDEDYTPRNAIRCVVITALEKLYPATVEHITEFARISQSHFDDVSMQAAAFIEDNSVPFCHRFRGFQPLGLGALGNEMLPKKQLRELSSPVRHEVYMKFFSTHNVNISFNLMNEIDGLVFSDQSKEISHNIESSLEYLWIHPKFTPSSSSICYEGSLFNEDDFVNYPDLKGVNVSFDKVSLPVRFERVRSQRVKPRSLNRRMNIKSYYRSIGLPDSVIFELCVLIDAKGKVVWFADLKP